jgi:RNA polymerase sigma-70 factor, ECF subfamily
MRYEHSSEMEGLNEFTSTVEKEKSFLFSHAMSLTRRSEDAEDLLQETLMKAYRGWDSFDSGTNFRAWAGRIMLNTHLNNVNRRRENVPCDFTTEECYRTIAKHSGADAATSEDPERIFFRNHIDDKLVESLYELPAQFRVPFSLFHFEGYLYEEISKMLKLPIGTVKSRIFRARKMLKDNIGEPSPFDNRNVARKKAS